MSTTGSHKEATKMSTTAAAVNQVTLVGNLTADPVIKQIDEDRRVCQLRLAVNDQKDQPPLFIDIATYGPQADRVRQIPRQRSGDCGHRPPGLPRVGGRGRLPALPAPRRRSRPSPNHRPGGLDHLRTIERQPSLQLSGAPIHRGMGHNQLVPINAGPVPDRLAIWPIDDGRYGLDATKAPADTPEPSTTKQNYHAKASRTASSRNSTAAGHSDSGRCAPST
jgi:hypothetical protein